MGYDCEGKLWVPLAFSGLETRRISAWVELSLRDFAPPLKFHATNEPPQDSACMELSLLGFASPLKIHATTALEGSSKKGSRIGCLHCICSCQNYMPGVPGVFTGPSVGVTCTGGGGGVTVPLMVMVFTGDVSELVVRVTVLWKPPWRFVS